jgi:signal transduction histidine kinase
MPRVARETQLTLILALPAMAITLYLGRMHDYLLFHSLAEIFSVAVACGVFMVSWNSRERDSSESRSLAYLGIGFLFTAILDIFHMLSYRGMGVLDPTRDYATKFWLAARYLQTASMLVFAFSLRTRFRPSYPVLFASFGAATILFLLLILRWNLFPTCFVEGVGLTPFKIISEYAISALLAVALLLILGAPLSELLVARLLAASLGLTIASELLFTLYTRSDGLANLLGHYLKIAAFFLAYQALIAHQLRTRLRTIHELEATEAALQEVNAAKDKFFSILGHDLRNPLSGLKTVAELLAERYDELSDAERRRFAGMLHEGADQSLALANSLLVWVRSQTGRIPCKPEAIDLAETSEEAIAQLHPAAERKKVRLQSAVPRGTRVYADGNMLATVLRNLLSNALKFTPGGGLVRVASELVDGQVATSVTDTGVGIDPGDMDKLFRIDSHLSRRGTEGESGNGLGLILCREFVERNGGRIWACSNPGGGSRFTFSLPPAAENAPGYGEERQRRLAAQP